MAVLAAKEQGSLFVSALTLGELRKGVEAKRRADPEAAARIAEWVDDIETTFTDRILPVDIAAGRRAAGRTHASAYLANLRRDVEALGGTLEMTARFPDTSVAIGPVG